VPRRALSLLCLPLLAGCPTFSHGPEASIPLVSSEECESAGLDEGCTSFEVDNGDVHTDPSAQPIWLRIEFEALERNLAYLNVEYSVPGMPLLRRTCSLSTEDDDEEVEAGFGCIRVTLLGDGEELIDPSSTAEGVLAVGASLQAPQPGSHAISAWLTDDNGFDSPVVSWQFPVLEPLRTDPDAPPAEE
jgi:hypothetical protein